MDPGMSAPCLRDGVDKSQTYWLLLVYAEKQKSGFGWRWVLEVQEG